MMNLKTKHLGQNFLVNKAIAQKVVQSANLSAGDFVLEIGPGKGILTEELVKKAGKVVAVEIDRNLANTLSDKFRNNRNIEIINEDILKVKFKVQSAKCEVTVQSSKFKNKRDTRYQIPDTKYKIVANLPYYITSLIIRMFLESENPPSEMILMVQKEVAERITAQPGKMSILSVAVQYYAKPELLFTVGRENFDPVPEVDSAVIKITYNKQPTTNNKEDVKKFFRVVRAGFCAKRKTLANNLANSFHLDKKLVEEKLKAAGLLLIIRAQELSVDNWKKLASIF